MFLVQLLLPTCDNERRRFSDALFDRVHASLAERFGGVTAYQRAPATGLWKRSDGAVDDDEVVMVEVEAPALDREWWSAFRRQLERDFKQDRVLIRAIRVEEI